MRGGSGGTPCRLLIFVAAKGLVGGGATPLAIEFREEVFLFLGKMKLVLVLSQMKDIKNYSGFEKKVGK